ncbi:MAG: ATP-binding cassette domain-containing protein [Lachnospiraceae bacterium]
MEKARIELQNISKSYYSESAVTQALRKTSLSFVHGEFVAVTGESGSGKSTLLNIIGGIDSYDEGEMIVNGRPTFQYTEEDWE